MTIITLDEIERTNLGNVTFLINSIAEKERSQLNKLLKEMNMILLKSGKAKNCFDAEELEHYQLQEEVIILQVVDLENKDFIIFQCNFGDE